MPNWHRWLVFKPADPLERGKNRENSKDRKHIFAEHGGIGRSETACPKPHARQQRGREDQCADEGVPGEQALAPLKGKADQVGCQEIGDDRGAAGDRPGGQGEIEQDDRRLADTEGAVGKTGSGSGRRRSLGSRHGLERQALLGSRIAARTNPAIDRAVIESSGMPKPE